MIKKGSKVTIHYTLTVDGHVVDSSQGNDPLTYTQGGGDIIPGLEEQLVGLAKGDKKTVTVSPDKGYGQPNPNAIQTVAKTSFQDSDNSKELKAGDVVTGHMGDQRFQAIIVSVDKDTVTLDLNHPLAGKTLTFAIEVIEVAA